MFGFVLIFVHFLLLPKINWCYPRWNGRQSIYTLIFTPIVLFVFYLFRIVLLNEARKVQFSSCLTSNVGSNVDSIRIWTRPYAGECLINLDITFIIFLILFWLIGVGQLVYLIILISQQVKQTRLNFIGYIKCALLLDFPKQMSDLEVGMSVNG